MSLSILFGKKSLLHLLSFIFFLSGFSIPSFAQSEWVNPFIGTGGHGHTYPGVSVPFGMVQMSPDSRKLGWDGCSGYHYSDTTLFGFSHTHLSGTGVSDYSDILFLPWIDDLPEYLVNFDSLASLKLSFSEQKAVAGLYECLLPNIQVKLTATARCGIQSYDFLVVNKKKQVLINLDYRDKVLESSLEKTSDYSIQGHRVSTAWAKKQSIFFYTTFSQPIENIELFNKDGRGTIALLTFSENSLEPLEIFTGISGVDIVGAKKNYEAEAKGITFSQLQKNCNNTWNVKLSPYSIQTNQDSLKNIFYTALYHSFLCPNVWSDVDGRYRGMDQQIHQSTEHSQYTVFSLWDTFRAAHPLYTLTDPNKVKDFVQSMLVMYDQGGKLPVWELAANETNCMIGYHAVPVIVDAYFKGLIPKTMEKKCFEACVQSGMRSEFGLDAYQKNGFIRVEDESESVSKTLEYAYDDYCIASFAKALGKDSLATIFYKRAASYQQLFDSSTFSMRPRTQGKFLSPFKPEEVSFHYTEANATQYSYFVPQDITTLIELHGGNEAFVTHLEAVFESSEGLTGRDQVDITGLVGQYAHGNEPSHHMAYLFTYANRPDLTFKYVDKIRKELYYNKPEGLCGNEDCGQMSAWYVLSALGMYQVNPSGENAEWILTLPLFDITTITLPNGSTLKIERLGKGSVLKKLVWNGRERNSLVLSHKELQHGGTLQFITSDFGEWSTFSSPGTKLPHSILVAPFFTYEKTSFEKFLEVQIQSPTKAGQLFYTIDGSDPRVSGINYQGTITLKKSSTLKAAVFHTELGWSAITEVYFNKKSKQYSIKTSNTANRQYTAGGVTALIDGLRGGKDFRTGNWMGFQGQDLIFEIDLLKKQKIQEVGVGLLQETRSWIVMPSEILFEYSLDGKTFLPLSTLSHQVPIEEMDPEIHTLISKVPSTTVRYLRLRLKNPGVLPEWHLGAGGETFIFIDEIIVR